MEEKTCNHHYCGAWVAGKCRLDEDQVCPLERKDA